MTKEELDELIKSDKDIFKEYNMEKINELILERINKFANSEEAFYYIDSVMKDNVYEFLQPECFRNFIEKLPEVMVKENLTSIYEKMIAFYDETDDEYWVNKEIKKWINNLSDEVKTDEFDKIITFATDSRFKESDLGKFNLIVKNFMEAGINPENYESVLRKINQYNTEETEQIIHILEIKIIRALPEEIKGLEYDNFSNIIINGSKKNKYVTSEYIEFASDLSSDFLIENYEKIVNQYLELKPNNFDVNRYFPDLIEKIFKIDDNKEINSENINNVIQFIKDTLEKAPEIFINCNSKCFEKILKSLPKKYFLDNSNLPIINELTSKLDITFSNNNIKDFLNYFDAMISSNPNAIIDNDICAQIFNFINEKTTDQQIAIEFKQIVEAKTKEIVESIDMSEYSKYIPKSYTEKAETMDKLTFEKFASEIKKLKLINGHIPEEYCDFIINQKLNNNTPLNENLDQYFPLLKRAFEDKTFYILKSEGIENYQIKFFQDEGDGTQGYHNLSKRTIGFLEDNLKELSQSNSHIINTMYHEIRHAIQSKNYNTTDFSKLDGSLFNSLKEEIIRKNEINFYKKNYSRMHCEIDARLAGARGQAEYLAYLGVPENQIIEGDSTKLKEFYEHAKKIERENEEFAINKIDENGNIISISEKVREFIKKDPELIKKYPVLSLEFNEDGTRKSTVEILQNALAVTKNGDKTNLEDIYFKIFEGNIKSDLDSTVQCLKYISNELQNNNYNREKMLMFVNLIIDNEVLYSLSKIEKSNENYNKVILELKKIAKDNTDLGINDKINNIVNQFESNSKIVYEPKIDNKLSDTAVSSILRRKVTSIGDFETIFTDIAKIIKEPEKSNFDIEFAFKRLFEQVMENHQDWDIVSLIKQSIGFIPKYNLKDVLYNTVRNMPIEMQKNNLKNFVKTFWNGQINEYEFFRISDAREFFKQINPEIIKDNPQFINQIFESILEPGEIVFLKQAETVEEFNQIIQTAKENGCKYSIITDGMKEILKDEAKKGNRNSIDMLYSTLDEYGKVSVISTFFIYAKDEFKEQNIEEILRHILIEKRYFKKDDVEKVIQKSIEELEEDAFKRNPELMNRIDRIKEQAMELVKQEDPLEKADEKIPSSGENDKLYEISNDNNVKHGEETTHEVKSYEEVTEEPKDEIQGDENATKEFEYEIPSNKDEISADDNVEQEIVALKKIYGSVSMQEKEEGENFIKRFLQKAIERARRVKEGFKGVFRGGDDDDRTR